MAPSQPGLSGAPPPTALLGGLGPPRTAPSPIPSSSAIPSLAGIGGVGVAEDSRRADRTGVRHRNGQSWASAQSRLQLWVVGL